MKIIFFLPIFVLSTNLYAQPNPSIMSESTISDTTTTLSYAEFRTMKKRAMKVLLAWGLANTVGGLVGQTKNASRKDYWTMNAGWGVVNAAIAGASLLFDKEKKTVEEQEKEIRQFSKILAINAGLDVGYIGTGVAMKNAPSQTTQQFGSSIALQGVWLLAFDAILYSKSKKFHPMPNPDFNEKD